MSDNSKHVRIQIETVIKRLDALENTTKEVKKLDTALEATGRKGLDLAHKLDRTGERAINYARKIDRTARASRLLSTFIGKPERSRTASSSSSESSKVRLPSRLRSSR